MTKTIINRGDIFWVSFDPSLGTEIQKTRPSLVCSHDIINENSTRIIVAPITSNLKRVYSFEYALLTHSFVKGKIMLDQLRAIDKSRLGSKIGSLTFREMNEIEEDGKKTLKIRAVQGHTITVKEFYQRVWMRSLFLQKLRTQQRLQ